MADNYGWKAPFPEDNHHHHHPLPHHHHHPYNGGGLPELYGSSAYLEKTSSFDSHGSPRMVHGYGYAPPVPYPPPFNPYFHQYPSPPPPMVINLEYITELNPKDVLSGRGGATNSYPGNRNFRKLVKSHQQMYLNAKKRDKPSVASKIVVIIREAGGRFLRRCNHKNARNVVWVDIGDDRAREKTCQALREGAPEIRRRNILASPENNPSPNSKAVCASLKQEQPSPTPTPPPHQPTSTITSTSPIVSSSSSLSPIKNNNHHHDASPLVVRPWKVLCPQRAWMELSVDALPESERELYVRDFLPPDPASEPLQ